MIRINLVWMLVSQICKYQFLTNESVSLPCFFSETIDYFQWLYWYKQTAGQMPQVVATVEKRKSADFVLNGEFNDICFTMEKVKVGYLLIINNISRSDEAAYFCGIGTVYEMKFRNGTCLAKRSQYQTVEQQPVSDPVHTEDYVTLQCTVLSETCTGEHSVYWFRAGSGESNPGVIYTPGNRSDDCEKSPETPSPTQTCVYSLSKNNLSLSDAGTYYCAVATCGEILFGNGTNLNIGRLMDHVVIGLGVTSVFCVIVIIILIFTRNTKPICEHYQVSFAQHIGLDNTTTECDQDQDGVTLNYAALNFSERKTKTGRKKRDTTGDCYIMYSDSHDI
uniref:Ig-like domain-containing protein n=1 Tax=Oncorhynchus tshawytscha TaxID=74940 RepID=A0AAZ3PWR2_ONCTS